MQPTENNSPAPDIQLYPDGFIAIKSGLFDHMEKGRMSASMLPVYCVLLKQCNWSTGIWNGNPPHLSRPWRNDGLSEIRKQLETLLFNLHQVVSSPRSKRQRHADQWLYPNSGGNEGKGVKCRRFY